ncbi:hypothetical protein WIS52_19245 [Pseudonocardia nematodicida]|uniref:Uncharacterized protein n=1 Tax=Pseudonocardia nematodicida TaxID=1206997 RepID=A0ABV1KDS2_9PSEU
MNTLTRTLASLVVSVTLAAGAGAACSTPHNEDRYISEMRGAMSDQENSGASDQQILATGRMMCSVPGALDTVNTTESDATPQYATYVEITRGYCDVLGTDTSNAFAPLPGTGTDPAATETTAAPTTASPIALGIPNALNYGGEDTANWTIDSLDWCGPYLRMNVTMTTSDLYLPGEDHIFVRTQWTDTEGITHDNAGIIAPDCGDELPGGYNTQPGKTYRGVQTFDIPQDQFVSLDIYGSDGRHHVYTAQS